MSLNVLMVDDSKTVLDVLARTLHLAGIDIGQLHRAGNGEEAMVVLQNNWVDLVFADINMPIMNGVQLVEKMAESGILATVPVIIVSTEGSAARMEQLKVKGISAYVRKPFTPEGIKQVVAEVLSRRTPEASGDERVA